MSIDDIPRGAASDLAAAAPADTYCRLLVCLRPPRAVQRLIADYLSLCHGLPLQGRTVPHRLHLTLLYSPRLHVGQLPALAHALQEVRFEPLVLQDFAPAPWRNGVAALLPTTASPRIDALRRQIGVAAQRAGIHRQSRSPTTAHVTVARLRQRTPPPMPTLRMNWQCDAFDVVHSTAYPAPYQPIARYPCCL